MICSKFLYIKQKTILLLFVICFSFAVNAQKATPKQKEYFNAGEKFKYSMSYGWITGGYASIELRETVLDNDTVFHATAIAATTGLTDKLYNVYDVYESWFDRQSILPKKAIRNIKEAKYRSYNEVIYHHDERKLKSLKSGFKLYPDSLPSKVFDVLSAFYLIRKNNFESVKVGDLITINTYFSDEFWLLQVKYIGTTTIKTGLGKFECMEFRPVVEAGRVFDTQDDLKIFISKDKNFIPIRAQMDIMVGSFKVDLIEYKGLKNELKRL